MFSQTSNSCAPVFCHWGPLYWKGSKTYSHNIDSIHISAFQTSVLDIVIASFTKYLFAGAGTCNFELEQIRCPETPKSWNSKTFQKASKGRLAITAFLINCFGSQVL